MESPDELGAERNLQNLSMKVKLQLYYRKVRTGSPPFRSERSGMSGRITAGLMLSHPSI